MPRTSLSGRKARGNKRASPRKLSRRSRRSGRRYRSATEQPVYGRWPFSNKNKNTIKLRENAITDHNSKKALDAVMKLHKDYVDSRLACETAKKKWESAFQNIQNNANVAELEGQVQEKMKDWKPENPETANGDGVNEAPTGYPVVTATPIDPEQTGKS